jgi:hypothetical protein
MLAKAPPPERLKPETIHAGDFVSCRLKRYREQLQLTTEPALVLEIKRSSFKGLYADGKRAWLPREAIVKVSPEPPPSPLLGTLHFILRRADADECEFVSAEGVHRVSARIDRIDAATIDELRTFLGANYVSLTVVPEGMAFMQLELTFR